MTARETFEAQVEAAIMYEIEHGTQRSVGALYAFAIKGIATDGERFRRINRAIISRWATGLERAKTTGWKVARAMEEAREQANV